MILQGGPLDGEQQCIYQLNTDPGSVLFFSVDNFQTFHPDSGGTVLLEMGLQVEYALVGPGPPPNPGPPDFDTWDTSWIFSFVEESYTYPPVPPFLPPPVPLPLPDVLVYLEGDTGMTINADDPSPGVYMTDTVTSMEIDADVESIQWAYVSMTGETGLTADAVNFDTQVALEGDTSMNVTST